MKVLAVETATEACSCALIVGERSYRRHQVAPRRHAELVLTFVDELLSEAGLALAELDGIAFGRGPGSFTGVRIAAGVAQGLAFGAGLDVAPVSTLQALAQGAYRLHGHRAVAVALDARLSEVYWGVYRVESGQACMTPQVTECVRAPQQVPIPVDRSELVGAGSGWAAAGVELSARLGESPEPVFADLLPDALDVAVLGARVLELGQGVPPEQALPVYLRNRVTS